MADRFNIVKRADITTVFEHGNRIAEGKNLLHAV